MDKHRSTPFTGNSSYSEKVIYDEIVANLGNYALEYDQDSDNEDYGFFKKEQEEDEFRLFTIMNDHNYISIKKEVADEQNLRRNLIDFTKTNSQCCTSAESTVEKLVDGVLNLLTKGKDYDSILEKIEKASDESKFKPALDECEKQTGDDKEPNVDIKAELNPLLSEDISTDVKVVSKTSLIDEVVDPAVAIPSDVLEILKKEPERPSDKDSSVNENNVTSPETVVQKEIQAQDPKPHESGDSKVDTITKPNELPSVINELLGFAEKLKEDCTKLPGSSDFNLESFLTNKLKEYKHIISPIALVDTAMQTENVISKKKLRKINAQDKRHLLESSNDSDSSSSSSSYIDKSLTELDTEYITRNPLLSEYQNCTTNKSSLTSKKTSKGLDYFRSDSDDSDNECEKSDLSQFDESFCSSLSKNENDNIEQTDQSNSTEKDKKSQENSQKTGDKKDSNHVHEKSRSKSTNESDKENNSVVQSPDNSLPPKSKQDEDVQDKEIERLLNLKNLADPQKNLCPTNNTKVHKNSGKVSTKTENLYAVMQELDKNSLSDDSIIEESERILTEKQFLVKCNENLKQQLLDSESSDSDNFSTDMDMDLRTKSNDQSGDEDGNHLSNVDKFLETLIANEEDSPTCNESNKSSTPSVIISEETPVSKTNDKKEILPKKKPDIEVEALDTKQKKSTEKSLETILASEKKPKSSTVQEDLIDLSGESGNSDAEGNSAEKEKSQRIKPMLRQDQLESGTIYAQKKETERLRRLEKRNTYLAKMLKNKTEGISETDLVLDYAATTKKFIKVHPDIVKHLKPHQRDGVKFMYDCCYGCVDDVKTSSGSGCILAHCMGLGKTLQIIALLHTVTTHKELKTSKVLVLCPKSTIMNWVDEIQRWLGPLEMKNLQIFNFTDTADIYEKINVLRQWSTSTVKAGVLIMGYEAFRSLVFYHSHRGRAKSTVRLEEIRKSISKNLLKPGADLVVCDEGHIIKNRKSGISLAAAEIVTPKRIVLTGTPIQNNLKEYYSMVNFIKPLILGTEKEFANLYANPIKNGQHKDSSKRDIKVMKQRSFVLHKKLSKFVQRKEAELLQSFLPQKFEYVLFIPMTDVQNNLYEYVLEAISKREDSRGRSLITDYTCLRKIWTHPKVLEDAWKNAMAAKNKREPKKQVTHSDDDQPDDIYDSQTGAISVERDWWRSLLTDTDLETILPSNKLKTMFEIIRMSEENGEKCLIFSAFVAVLNVVETFLNKLNEKQRNVFMFEMKKPSGQWINGQDYYRLDGKTNKTLRHEMVKRFNDPKNKRTRLFLISAKAGGQGINLIGANRVIILDTSWNPANDQQNIFRIFRLGQKKNCYVYRLIAMGTMEEKVYSRSVTKQAMSFRVVDEQQIDRHYSMAELAELYTLTKPCFNERPVPVFPQDQILANLLLNFPDLVYKYHEHDSLLENKVEQELSEQEKADAWIAYERDLQLNSEPREAAPGYHGYPFFGQGNYMYPMGDFDPNNIHPGAFDLSQLDMATKNALTSPLLPNYLVNRNSYLELLNMYKNFPSLLNEKNRNSRFNPGYPMSLPPSLMNSPAFGNMLPSAEAHLSALSNPFYPLHSLANSSNAFSNPLSTNPMVQNPNFPSPNQANADRYEANKSLLSIEESIASTMRNYHLSGLSFPKDPPPNRPMQPKNLPTPPPGPPTNLMHSPTRQLAQNLFGANMGKDAIPKNLMSRKRSKNMNKLPFYPTGMNSEPVSNARTPDSLIRSPSPSQSANATTKLFEPPLPMSPLNLGMLYPKTSMSTPLSPSGESNEGARLMASGGSMQIIPAHSQLSDNVRKKFDNISPNISLTAVRAQSNSLLSEQLPTNQLDATASMSRKRRSSLGELFSVESENEQMYPQGNTQSNGNPSGVVNSHFHSKIAKY